MADLTWRAYRSATEGGTYTQLNNIQRLSMRLGRIKVTDQWRPSTAIIAGIDPDSLPAIKVNDFIKINNTSNNYDYWFRVADFRIEYDYTTNGDTWEITCESSWATVGRSNVSATVAAGDETLYVMGIVLTDAPVSFAYNNIGKSITSAITLADENPIATVQKLAQTEQAYFADYDFENTLTAFERGTATAGPFVTLTDDLYGTTTYVLKYDRITFQSLAEDYVDGVVVNPAAVASQTAGTLGRSFSVDTFDNTTSQAADLAAYLNVVLSQETPQPTQIRTNVKTWANATPLTVIRPGEQITVRLRGDVYDCVLEGMFIDASPSQTFVTLNLSPATAYAFLTLDDAVLGRLDYNALGF